MNRKGCWIYRLLGAMALVWIFLISSVLSSDSEVPSTEKKGADLEEAEIEGLMRWVKRFPRDRTLAKPVGESEAPRIDVLHYNIAVRIFPSEERFSRAKWMVRMS